MGFQERPRCGAHEQDRDPSAYTGKQDFLASEAEVFEYVVETFERVRSSNRSAIEMPVFEKTRCSSARSARP